MFSWNEKYCWNFSDAGPTVPNQGPAITGTKIFRGGIFKNVVRETIQNSLDAKDENLPEDIPVRVEYELMYLDRSDVPGSEELSRVIDLCYDYISSLEDVKLDDIEVLREANNRLLKKNRIPVLRISDYNTVGLIAKNYNSLMNNEGLTTKTDDDTAGSFGFGKFAPYLLSPVNAILYCSLTSNEDFRFVGRAFLSTFKKDGKRKMGISLFGELSDEQDQIIPVRTVDDVPAVFSRDENGTDLYILCFDHTEDWIDQTAISTLENFFYAIWKKKLTVVLKEGDKKIEFTSDNIGDMIDEYDHVYHEKYESEDNNFKFTAPMFWNVIKMSNSDVSNAPISFSDFRGKGEVLLYLYMDDSIEDKAVLRMRNSGMKIDIATKFYGLPAFNAVLVATGEGKKEKDYNGNISKFLRELESPAHDNWAIENITKPLITREAELVLKGLNQLIKNEVTARIPRDDGTPIDIFGLNRILPNVVEEGSEQIEESAVFNFVPIPVDTKDAKKKKKDNPIKRAVRKYKKHDPEPTPKPDPKPDPEPDPNPITIKPQRKTHQREKIVAVPLPIKEVRTPFLPERNCYHISVIPKADASLMLLKLRICGDDSATFDVEVMSAQSGSHRYVVKDGYIQVPSIKAGVQFTCDVILSEPGRYALEVKAYAKK